MIGLRQFEQFLAVAESMSFRQAAERLNMAQPPLTMAIRQMEAELGVRLLERSNRITALTPAGAVLVEEARKAIKQASRALDFTRRTGAGEIGTIRLGFVASAAKDVLPRLIVAFRKGYPEVSLQLAEATSAKQVWGLPENTLDAGLIVLPLPFNADNRLRVASTVISRLVAAIPADDPLARQTGPLELAELRDKPWILFPENEGPGLYSVIAQACARVGFVPRVAQQAIQMDTIVSLVAAGLGVALVPQVLSVSPRPGVVFRDVQVPDGPIDYALGLACRANIQTAVLTNFFSVAGDVMARTT